MIKITNEMEVKAAGVVLQNTLVHGDCMEVMKYIPDGFVDCVLTDPPYGTTACKWDTIIPFEQMWEQLKRITKKNGAIVLFSSQPFTSALVMSNPKMFKYEWVWEKERPTNIFLLKKQVGKVHENICVFYDKQPNYNPILEASKQPKNNKNNKSQVGEMNTIETYGNTKTKISSNYNPTKRFPRSVLKIDRGTKNNKKIHPTQKPVALMEYLIRTYTNEGETVLDFTMGSFTTAIACLNTKRSFIGIEKDEHYFQVGKDRFEKHLSTLDYTTEIIYTQL